MVHDPVMADLRRHLNQIDEDEARAEAVEEIIEDWLEDKDRISEIIADELNLPEDLHDIVVQGFLGKNYERFGLWVKDLLTETFQKDDDATDEYVASCLGKSDLVLEVLRDELALDTELNRILVTCVMTKDYWRFFGWIEDLLREKLMTPAEKEFDRRVEQGKQDAAEAKALSREDFGE